MVLFCYSLLQSLILLLLSLVVSFEHFILFFKQIHMIVYVVHLFIQCGAQFFQKYRNLFHTTIGSPPLQQNRRK